MSYVGRPSSTQALQSGRDLCPAGADFFGTIAIFWTSSKVLGDRQAKGLLRPHKDLVFQQSRCEFSLVKTLPQAMEHGTLAVMNAELAVQGPYMPPNRLTADAKGACGLFVRVPLGDERENLHFPGRQFVATAGRERIL